MKYTVELSKLVEKMELTNITPDINISDIQISTTDVNRPALQLADFYDYFDGNRVQVIGQVEYSYMLKIGTERTIEMVR